MTKAPRPDPEGDEPDRFPGAPHPREAARLVGHAAAEAAFLAAHAAGRLHHAWLVAGPEGVGKATFAYRAARFLLAHPAGPPPGARDLSLAPDHPVARQVAARAHPDLAALRRGAREGSKGWAAETSVGEVRRATRRLESTAGAGGWRAVVVDAAEDLNEAAANGLLKALEEPPARAVFFLVSHAPGRLLPTVRSRCRRLDLRPLGDEDVARAIGGLGAPWSERPADAVAEAARLGRGSVRASLALLDEGRAALRRRADALLRAPRPDPAAATALAELAGGRDGVAFGVLREAAEDRLAALLRAGAARGAPLAPVAAAWDRLRDLAREAEELNLDRRPVALAALEAVAGAARALGLPLDAGRPLDAGGGARQEGRA